MLLATGCETVGYYGQAIRGQADLLLARRAVAELVTDAGTEPALRERLRLAKELLAFAETELSLPVDGRYRHYVALDRDAVVYNVFAAPPYDLVPVRWCFPIAGCVSYRGYFSETAARAKADALAASGLDVHVGGAAAYSTLGWFDDPLLSTFIDRDDPALAELLFHELAHGVLYVPGETAFNESFATFVGREGARRWLAARGEEAALARWEARSARRADFVRLTLELRAELAEGYAALRSVAATEGERAARKAALWETLRAAWFARRSPELAPWDGFFTAEASNARLNTVADYNVHLPAFATLFAETGADLPVFLQRCRALAADADARATFMGSP
ncbi:MAG: aminopeptidase [Pseudomonadales bacterium]|jgi:predicted aminopeptidase|nr:aminopeptidase [Pseudomonadales bacterium]